ncbi:MAG: hypothetical protein IJQ47_06140 [Synergistaceae bacterium]|nr:hypothetical protein [Synergistaceae bacterium]
MKRLQYFAMLCVFVTLFAGSAWGEYDKLPDPVDDVIDLGGNTYTLTTSGNLYTLNEEGKTVTIKNGTIKSTVTGAFDIITVKKGILKLGTGLKIEAPQGAAIYVNGDNAEIIIDGAEIESESGKENYALATISKGNMTVISG